MKYSLKHLSQPSTQEVFGPIQDDEALFLFGLIRSARISRILEVGGLDGYSAQNFLEAASCMSSSAVYSVDFHPVPKMGEGHKHINRNAKDVCAEDLDNLPVGLVFFDCHDQIAEMELLRNLTSAGIINDDTYLVLHDTNLHPQKLLGHSYQVEGGWVHVRDERAMVNSLHDMGYDCISLSTAESQHDNSLPFRHGLTICKKFRKLIL